MEKSLLEIYSSAFDHKMCKDELHSFIKSELARISIIYFSCLNGVKVHKSEANKSLKLLSRPSSLLNEKYQEHSVSELIDKTKSEVKAYLLQ